MPHTGLQWQYGSDGGLGTVSMERGWTKLGEQFTGSEQVWLAEHGGSSALGWA